MKIKSSNTTPPTFPTSSLEIAAFLLASDIELLGYDRQDDGRLVFRFPASAEDSVAKYFAGASIPAIRFWSEIGRLKSIIFSGMSQ